MKRKVQILVSLFLAAVLLSACQRKEPSMRPMEMGDYWVRLDSAGADPYNRVVRYALTRRDGGEIAPDAHFGTMESMASGSSEYIPSPDGKTIWLEERMSRGRASEKTWVYTLTLGELTVGGEVLNESQSVRCEIPVTYQMTQLLEQKREFQLPQGQVCTLTRAEISPLGLHLEMEVPVMDIGEVNQQTPLSVVMDDGVVIDLEKHMSAGWSEGDKTCMATCEVIFEKDFDLTKADRLVLCGIIIPIVK